MRKKWEKKVWIIKRVANIKYIKKLNICFQLKKVGLLFQMNCLKKKIKRELTD